MLQNSKISQYPDGNWLKPKALPLAIQILLLSAAGNVQSVFAEDLQLAAVELAEINVAEEREGNKGVVRGYVAKTNTTAVKTDTPLIDLPQSLTVITPEQMKDQNIQSIADSVRYVPGVGVSQGEGNRDSLIFRGNSSTSDMYVDGIRDDVQYYRDMYNIERVDVLKGPNAMVFGRGGSGGLINRATKQANWLNQREASLQIGSFDKYRLSGDFDQAINDQLAFRFNTVWENARSFREGFDSARWGLNPTMTWQPDDRNKLTWSFEHYEDSRVADRGVSSYQGRPVNVDISTFFGDPNRSPTGSKVDAFNLQLEHDFGGGASLRNRSRYAHYDKFYQNIYPGAVSADGSQVSISAYNNATQRENFINQTDLIFKLNTGSWTHTILAGTEIVRQNTSNLRNTGYFTAIGPNTTSVKVDLDNPIYAGPISFRPSATDANNQGVATTYAGYFQDQLVFNQYWQAIFGVRYDRFEMDFINNRSQQNILTYDNLVSPRGGLIFKPFGENFSLYANYSIAYVPRAGEQLSSLTLSNQTLKPEEFRNYELGAKWDITGNLSTTLAFFQLDRLNALATDPNNPAQSSLVDGQRTRGIEWGFSGNLTERWRIMGGYAYQDGEITKPVVFGSITAQPGANQAQLPEHSFSLWNRYDINDRWGVGLGAIYRSKMYAAVDNTVTLPGFLRFDAAVYYQVSKTMQLQVNVENLFDKQYYATATNNTNIMPGSPIAATAGFNIKF